MKKENIALTGRSEEAKQREEVKKQKSEKANFDPTASIPTTTTENETALDETTMDETTADEASIAAQEDDFEHSPRKRIYERTVGRPGSGLGPDEKSGKLLREAG